MCSRSLRFIHSYLLLTSVLDIDAPIPAQSGGGAAAAAPEPTPDQIAMLSDMGFTPAQARKALRETVIHLATFSFPAHVAPPT